MGQITKSFAESLLKTNEQGKHMPLTCSEERQLVIAWLALHGYMTWEGMPEDFKIRARTFAIDRRSGDD